VLTPVSVSTVENLQPGYNPGSTEQTDIRADVDLFAKKVDKT
jgi:hypothetical protein